MPIFFFKTSKLIYSFAEIGKQITSPPNSSGINPYADKSNITDSTSASGLSILLIATIKGMCICLAKLITSIVCYWMDSTAEITRIIMSVTFAPLALIF